MGSVTRRERECKVYVLYIMLDCILFLRLFSSQLGIREPLLEGIEACVMGRALFIFSSFLKPTFHQVVNCHYLSFGVFRIILKDQLLLRAKNIAMECRCNAAFFNYKNFHSILLLATCDQCVRCQILFHLGRHWDSGRKMAYFSQANTRQC